MFFLDVNFIFALAFFPKSNKTVEDKNLKPATYKVVVLGDGGVIKTLKTYLLTELLGTTKNGISDI